jgi:hypothetical protein
MCWKSAFGMGCDCGKGFFPWSYQIVDGEYKYFGPMELSKQTWDVIEASLKQMNSLQGTIEAYKSALTSAETKEKEDCYNLSDADTEKIIKSCMDAPYDVSVSAKIWNQNPYRDYGYPQFKLSLIVKDSQRHEHSDYKDIPYEMTAKGFYINKITCLLKAAHEAKARIDYLRKETFMREMQASTASNNCPHKCGATSMEFGQVLKCMGCGELIERK